MARTREQSSGSLTTLSKIKLSTKKKFLYLRRDISYEQMTKLEYLKKKFLANFGVTSLPPRILQKGFRSEEFLIYKGAVHKWYPRFFSHFSTHLPLCVHKHSYTYNMVSELVEIPPILKFELEHHTTIIIPTERGLMALPSRVSFHKVVESQNPSIPINHWSQSPSTGYTLEDVWI